MISEEQFNLLEDYILAVILARSDDGTSADEGGTSMLTAMNARQALVEGWVTGGDVGP